MTGTEKHERKEDRPLSRLELTVLGLVSSRKDSTAYWNRRQFQSSPSSHFSGSAGAIYPAMQRLEDRGLLKSTAERNGVRRHRLYRLTPLGRRHLRSWLLPPVPAEDVAFSMDPIRTRVYYLKALSATERRHFVEDALSKARRHASVVEEDCEARRRSGDELSYLAARGVLHEMRARVRWLEELRRAVAGRKAAGAAGGR